MSGHGWELVASDEPTIVAKPLLGVMVTAMDVLPVPPGPMRAIGVRFSTKPRISSIKLSRQKQALGARGVDSPGILDANTRYCIHS